MADTNRAALAEQIRTLMAGLVQDGMLRDLPMIAPQSVQSGNPTPQNVGQTLGPQPGERRNATRGELANEFTQAAGSFAASAADPLGIPSAITGMISPEMRDSWRQYQGAAGPVVQMAGGMATGIPAVGALWRGGNALAGTAGRIAGGAVSGMAPTIDYGADVMQGNPNADPVNAMIGPLAGAALPAGMAAAGPVVNAIRGNPLAAAAGGATALAAGGAVAQQGQGQGQTLDDFTRNLHANNPALAAAYQRLQAARQSAATANQTSVTANQGRNTNSGARQAAERADAAAAEAARAYETLLRQATDQARADNPTFREAYGPIWSNRIIRSTALPLAAGLLSGAAGASMGRLENRLARREISAGNAALEAGNIPAAATAATTANAMVAPRGSSWVTPGIGLAGLFGGEMATAPQQWNQEAPRGSPERIDADNYMNGFRMPIDFAMGALMGATAYKGGRQIAGNINSMIPGRNRMAAGPEAEALQRRVAAATPPPQQASPPVVVPPVPPAPPAPPPGNQPPIDYQTMLNQIGARPLPPVAANTNVPRPTNAGAGLYRGELQANIRNQIARQLLRDGRINLDMLRSAMEREGVMPGVIARARTAAESANAAIVNGATPAAVAAALRRGGIENLSVIGAAGAAGVAAHHSASQPRGADGRFETAE